jgi:alkylated DNA nucleotide flippase Atl1
LAKAPKGYQIPWHRIVYACGRVWTSPQYDTKRLKLYEKEGIKVGKQGKIQNFEEILWEFS